MPTQVLHACMKDDRGIPAPSWRLAPPTPLLATPPHPGGAATATIDRSSRLRPPKKGGGDSPLPCTVLSRYARPARALRVLLRGLNGRVFRVSSGMFLGNRGFGCGDHFRSLMYGASRLRGGAESRWALARCFTLYVCSSLAPIATDGVGCGKRHNGESE